MAKFTHRQLQLHNPWWIRQELILEDEKLMELQKKKYQWHHPFLASFPKEKYVLFTLRGPRQIGKTTLLKLIIKKLLLEERKEKEAVFFFPCDTIEDYKELEELLGFYLDFAQPRTGERLFIFLDEISFVTEWQRTLKLFVDMGRLRNTLVVLTGSNILDLKFSSERLPGRRGEFFQPDIEIAPLTFQEFISLVAPELAIQDPFLGLSNLPKYQKLFEDYLLTGGFPANINYYYSDKFIPIWVYEQYLSWIEGDLHKVGKSEKLAYNLVREIIKRLTTPVSWYRLGREAGISSFETVNDYLEILEKMFVVSPLHYFSLPEKKSYYRKNKKVYFTDPFIFHSFAAKIDGFLPQAFNYSKNYLLSQEKIPSLVEMVVTAILKRNFQEFLFYGRSQEKEIDFVGYKKGRYSYFEVKYQSQVDSREFIWAKELIPGGTLTILSKKDYFYDKKILIVPAELFLASLC